MKLVSNLNIGIRLSLGFGLVLLFASGLLALGMFRMSQLQDSTAFIFNTKVASLDAATDMQEQGRELMLVLRKLTAPVNQDEAERAARALTQTLERYAKVELQAEKLIEDVSGKAALHATMTDKQPVLVVVEKIRGFAAQGNTFDAATILQNNFSAPHERWLKSLGVLAQEQHNAMKVTYDNSQANYRGAMFGMAVIGFGILLLGSLAAWIITKTISTPIKLAGRAADRIAGGDLSHEIAADSRDEVGDLLRSLRSMQGNLLNMIARIKIGTQTMLVASKEIATGNADLSSRTELQASSLEQTAGSMLELTRAVKQNADNALTANQVVLSASDAADKGGLVVGEVVKTMEDIRSSSSKIADIIGVIDGIAFQTNILALNAAVEAARAGEQGRGFAVVAAEVRSLAHRSANSAKDIKKLIGDAVGKVDYGSQLVAQAGETMNTIVVGVRHAAAIMNEISAASKEQSVGIEKINLAIMDMDDMTQKNSALVEQAAAAAQSMKEQAVALGRTVDIFKTDELQKASSIQYRQSLSTTSQEYHRDCRESLEHFPLLSLRT